MKLYSFCLFLFSFLNVNPPLSASSADTIYVAQISWHSGLIIPTSFLPDSIWPADSDYSQAPFLEIGWGDRDFYQTPGFNPWYAFKAVVWPTKSAIHINPIHQPLTSYYSDTRLVRIIINQQQKAKLLSFLMHHFETGKGGKLIELESGIYWGSQFFAATKRYYWFRNSNTWVAMALQHLGIRLFPPFYLATECVLNRAAISKTGEFMN